MVDRHNGRYTALLSAGRQRCISAHSHSLPFARSEEHTSELQSLMRSSYAVLCLKKKTKIRPPIQFYQKKDKIDTEPQRTGKSKTTNSEQQETHDTVLTQDQ